MSRCSGRSPAAQAMLDAIPIELEIAIPTVCFMEAYKAFSALSEQKRAFQRPFSSHIADIRRDPGSYAQEFAKTLAAADAALTNYLGESEDRLEDSISEVLGLARLLETSVTVLSNARRYLSDPTDDMILSTIIEDAQKSNAPPMRFLSEDRGYDQPSIQAAFRAVGIETFNDALGCVAWIESL